MNRKMNFLEQAETPKKKNSHLRTFLGGVALGGALVASIVGGVKPVDNVVDAAENGIEFTGRAVEISKNLINPTANTQEAELNLETHTYTVIPGDNFEGIAREETPDHKEGITGLVDELKGLNPQIKNASDIRPGDELIVPGPPHDEPHTKTPGNH